MEPESSLQCSQEPAIGPYLEPDQSSPYHPIPVSVTSILIHVLFSHLRLGISNSLFPYCFATKIQRAFIFPPIRATCPDHLILIRLIF
jgi:hypothetical protein